MFPTGWKENMTNAPSYRLPTPESALINVSKNGGSPLSSDIYKNITDTILRGYAKDSFNISREAAKVYSVPNKSISKTWHSKFRDCMEGAAMAFNPLPINGEIGEYHALNYFDAVSGDMSSVSDDINSVLVAIVFLHDQFKTK
jgi:hypothetical protein